jgi:hypothetical protein
MTMVGRQASAHHLRTRHPVRGAARSGAVLTRDLRLGSV